MIYINKKYTTRNGRPVTLLTTTAVNADGFCVIGTVKDYAGYDVIMSWSPEGCFCYDTNKLHKYDLVATESVAIMPVKLDKTYQTLDGQPVRLLCIDKAINDYPVVGIINGEQDISTWTITGRYHTHQDYDLHPLNLIEIHD